jgi:hypothetical protein
VSHFETVEFMRRLFAFMVFLALRAWSGEIVSPVEMAAVQPTTPAPNQAEEKVTLPNDAKSCANMIFTGYSTKGGPEGKAHIQEKFWWDAKTKSFKVQGPILLWMLHAPDTTDDSAVFTIPVGRGVRSVSERSGFCRERYQESARCDFSGTLYFTQSYTNCDFQAVKNVYRIKITNLGDSPGLSIETQNEMTGAWGGATALSDRDLRSSVVN